MRLLAVLALAAAVGAPVWAAPPDHAPAHGWRKKNDPNYVGYTGRKWTRDYGVTSGSCNMQAVGAVVGGVIGGAVGSRVGNDDDRVIATVVGTVIGAVVGASVGRGMDEADRACLGHSLEVAGTDRTVRWVNPRSKVTYIVTPGRGYTSGAQSCREFTAEAATGNRSTATVGRACRTGDGVWRLTES